MSQYFLFNLKLESILGKQTSHLTHKWEVGSENEIRPINGQSNKKSKKTRQILRVFYFAIVV